MKKITIYTDGACSGNPGDGGYGAILMYGDYVKEISGGEINTTNNRMEMKAVIEALKMLKEPCEVEIYSDSAYVVNAFNENWIENWRAKSWRKSDGKAVLNVELWQMLIKLTNKHSVKFIKVKGHSDNEFNNRCDELARGAINQLRENNISNAQ